MPPFIPTPREISLLGVLLVFLLYVSTTLKTSNLTVRDIVNLRSNVLGGSGSGMGVGGGGGGEEWDGKQVTLESQYGLEQLNSPVKWGLGQVPQTQILAHVPGTFFPFLDAQMFFITCELFTNG